MSKPIRNRGTASQAAQISQRLRQLRKDLDNAQEELRQARRQLATQADLMESCCNRLGRIEEQTTEQRQSLMGMALQAPAAWDRANYTYALNCAAADVAATGAQLVSVIRRLQPPTGEESKD